MKATWIVLLSALLPAALHAQPPEGLAGLYGETLGAAQGCPGIAPERLNTTLDRAAKHLKETAANDTAADIDAKNFAAGIARGRDDIAHGVITCAQAESELTNLEHDLSP